MPMSVHLAPVPVRTRQVYVVSTTSEGTEAALRVAMEMAREHAACPITIFVPRPKPEPDGIGQTEGSDRWLVARFALLARKVGARRCDVRTRVCDDVREAVKQHLPASAIGVVGGRHRMFWPSAEERLAARIRRSGRHVVFVAARRVERQRTVSLSSDNQPMAGPRLAG
jgi:hypothetical protein